MIFRIIFSALLIFFLNSAEAAKQIPFLSSPVIDEVGLLNGTERTQLESYIRSQKDLLQMQVWVTRLEGEDIEGLSYRAAREWKLGTENRDNGLLVLIAPAEKRMRIEVGRGLEGDIPDILAGRILDNVMRPRFRSGNFALGIQEALQQLVILAGKGPQAEGLKKSLNKRSSGKGSPLSELIVIIVMGIGILIFQRLVGVGAYGSRRYRYSHGGFWGSGGSGGGWSSGGSSGWSGGGGSFGGGGSSSSW